MNGHAANTPPPHETAIDVSEQPVRRMYQDGEKHNRSMDDVLEYTSSMPTHSLPAHSPSTHAPYEKLAADRANNLSSTPVAPPPQQNHAPINGSLQVPAVNHNDLHSTSFDTTDYVIKRHASSRQAQSAERQLRGMDSRIVKSHSAHGHLVGAGKAFSVYSYGLGSLSGRHLSQSELEHLRRSQIFTLLKGKKHLNVLDVRMSEIQYTPAMNGMYIFEHTLMFVKSCTKSSLVVSGVAGLHVENLEPMLPPVCDPFLGRKEEKHNIAEILNAPGRVVTLTGCPGVGKSNLAIAAANEMIKHYVNPIYVNCRACMGVEGVRLQIMRTFGLFFKSSEMEFFYNWVNSHEQRLLLIFDNIDLEAHMHAHLSRFIDDLLFHVKNLRILSTSMHQFYRGDAVHETYHVDDIRQYSDTIVDMLVPDLHQEGKQALVTCADHVLFGLYLCGKAFAIPNVDAGRLYEDVTSQEPAGLSSIKLQDAIDQFTTNELEQDRLFKLGLLVRRVLEHLPAECLNALCVINKIPADFDLAAATELSRCDSESLQEYLDELAGLGLLHVDGDRFKLPYVLKLVLHTCWPDNNENVIDVVKYFVGKLADWKTLYGSAECGRCVRQMRADYTNVAWVLRWLIEREDTYEYCACAADMDYAMLLADFLPKGLYEDLYESLSQQADEQDDVITKTNAIRCLAYKSLTDGQVARGKSHAESAYESMRAAQLAEKDKAFCMYCLGKAYWESGDDTRQQGFTLVKSALDIYRQHASLKSLKAIIVNEEYGRMLAVQESYQRARHVFNLSDLVMRDVADSHPLLLPSYDIRRAIWDAVLLFGRAGEMALKAVNVAQEFYGDHPVTASMMMRHCECIMKRGSLHECIDTCIKALMIRVKVYGEHKDTALSYKSLAYLMLRSGQYDEAVRFGQCALDIYEKIDAAERFKMDVNNLMTQARHRLESRSSVFADSKQGSRSDLHNQSCFASFSTEV